MMFNKKGKAINLSLTVARSGFFSNQFIDDLTLLAEMRLFNGDE
jgi:hypothetical protein